MLRALKWLYPGMRVKRWIAVIFVGVFLSNFGAALLIFGFLSRDNRGLAGRLYTYAALGFLVGGLFLLTGVYRLMKSLAELLARRGRDKDLVDVAFERRYLGLGPRVVALGGGTGMSTLLEGLKDYTAQVTAVVSVADDGGSSGRLRREFDMLPPGDIRKCLVALSDESPLLGELMQYRFSEADASGPTDKAELVGHSFGNLFLTVLWRLTGDFGEAVRQAGRILSIRGRVIPSTLDRVSLVATYQDGSAVTGQRQISENAKRIDRIQLRPKPGPASSDILEALEQADLIIIGPGSLYTSVLPNLLIEGVTEAIRRSTAAKVYVANIVSQEGETRGYDLKDHLEAVRRHTGASPFDLVLVNSSSLPPPVLKKWRRTSPGGRTSFAMIPRSSAGRSWRSSRGKGRMSEPGR
ncbi:MAG: gluconeogenesis factor YvcK family protein [Planctomycetota bacterium]